MQEDSNDELQINEVEAKANQIYQEINGRLKALENPKDKFLQHRFSEIPNRMYALYGKWGSGKTTLLEELEKIATKSEFEVVWFRPWEYYDETKDIDKKLLGILLKDRIKEDPRRRWWLIGTFIGLVMFAILNIIDFSQDIWIFFISLDIYQKLWFSFFSTTLITWFIWYISKNKWIRYIPNILFGGVNIKEILEISTQIQDYTVASEEIKKLITKSLGKDSKILVFVDELDRCQKETVIEVLEHIKHFYNVEQLYFIFALDRNTLAHYISEHYHYQNSAGILDTNRGYQYLDKLFPYSYTLQYLDKIEIFKSVLKRNSVLDRLDGRDIDLYYLIIKQYTELNWRQVNSLVYRFSKIYAKMEYCKVLESYGTYISLDEVFRWCVACEFYPEIFNQLDWKSNVSINLYSKHDNGNNLLNQNALSIENMNIYLGDIDIYKFEYLYSLYNYSGTFYKDEQRVQYNYKSNEHNPYQLIVELFEYREDTSVDISTPLFSRKIDFIYGGGVSRYDNEIGINGVVDVRTLLKDWIGMEEDKNYKDPGAHLKAAIGVVKVCKYKEVDLNF